MSLNIEEHKHVTKLTPELWLSNIWNVRGHPLSGAVLLYEWSWILTMAAKHKAFSWTEEANGLQFSFMMEVLPSKHLKTAQFIKAGSIKWDNQYFFQSLEAMMYGRKKWLQTNWKLMLLLSEWEIHPWKKKKIVIQVWFESKTSEYY